MFPAGDQSYHVPHFSVPAAHAMPAGMVEHMKQFPVGTECAWAAVQPGEQSRTQTEEDTDELELDNPEEDALEADDEAWEQHAPKWHMPELR